MEFKVPICAELDPRGGKFHRLQMSSSRTGRDVLELARREHRLRRNRSSLGMRGPRSSGWHGGLQRSLLQRGDASGVALSLGEQRWPHNPRGCHCLSAICQPRDQEPECRLSVRCLGCDKLGPSWGHGATGMSPGPAQGGKGPSPPCGRNCEGAEGLNIECPPP